MQNSWLEPPQIHHRGEGQRPSVESLMSLIDREDPAFMHITAALREIRAQGQELDERRVADAVRIGRQRYADPEPAQAPADTSIVYYIRRGSLIKIGTTRKPRTRFRNLLPDEILAFEPGARNQEVQRHQQFGHLRVHDSEHFEIGPDLLAHCDALRQQHGDPDPLWATTTNIRRRRMPKLPEPPAPTSAEMVTATEGATRLGIKRGTVQGWVHRGRLQPVASDEQGRPLYFLDHVSFLAAHSASNTRVHRPMA